MAEIAAIDRLAMVMARDEHTADLTHRQICTLTLLDTLPKPCSVKTIAEVIGTNKQTITRALDALENRDLARRRVHPTDRRQVDAHLTDAGRALLEKLRAA